MIEDYIDLEEIARQSPRFKGAAPFDHFVIENFFRDEIAQRLAEEFPAFDSDLWHVYHNAIEDKKTCNDWNKFPPLTYKVFALLNSAAFVERLSELLGIPHLESDPGLNGGGWHAHRRGGKLNVHLDYNIHPKLELQRKLNIIIYMNPRWQSEWGGQLGLWAQHPDARKPGDLVQRVDPLFNRAVLFDTTQQSWHGLPQPLVCPPDEVRQSLAAYYLAPAPAASEPRGKALFAPAPGQENDPAVADLIRRRAETISASAVYRAPVSSDPALDTDGSGERR